MSKSQLSQPKLRFRGFLREKINLLKLMDINIESNEFKESNIFIDAESINSNTTKNYTNEIFEYCPEDSIIFIKDGASAGTFMYANKNCKIASTCSYIKTTIWNSYLYFLLFKKTNIIKNKLIIGNTIPHLYKKNLLNLDIKLHESFLEQQKIAQFFSLLDHHIKLWERKLELYLLKKKFYLDKMFEECLSDNKDKIDNKYCINIFENLVKIKKGDQINNRNLKTTGNYYYQNGGINHSGFLNKYNRNENTISISEGGESSGYVKFHINKFWSGGHLFTLDLIDTNIIDVKYLYFLLKKIEPKIMSLKVGGALPNLQKKDLEKIKICYLKNLNEQQKIASFFEQKDKYINLCRLNIEKIKNRKKYYLNNLFI